MDTSDKVLGLIVALLILGVTYIIIHDNIEDDRVISIVNTNLKTHTNTHISKVVNVGYDFHYSKNNTSLTPTYLLEDGSIIREDSIEFEQQKFTPFVKVGDSIEYTVEIQHDLTQDWSIIRAHIVGR